MNEIKNYSYQVVLHNIRSAYNVGSIFRSADAFGVDKVFLGGYTPTPTNHSGIAKTALGAEQNIPWEKHWQTFRLLEKFRREGFNIVALEQGRKSVLINNFKPKFPLVLVLGNERTGLSSAMLKRADQLVEIPMLGKKESLNVAVAFGIAGYLIGQRRRL